MLSYITAYMDANTKTPHKPKLHVLKCRHQMFKKVVEGHKTFEWRKNDRSFHEGDFVLLRAWEDSGGGQYLGPAAIAHIGTVLSHGYELPEGYCVFSLLDVTPVYELTWPSDTGVIAPTITTPTYDFQSQTHDDCITGNKAAAVMQDLRALQSMIQRNPPDSAAPDIIKSILERLS